MSEQARRSDQGIITTLKRLINTPDIRERLGIEIDQGIVYSNYPKDEVARALTRVVDDLKTASVTVPDVYHANQRIEYARKLPRTVVPRKSTRLDNPVSLDDLASGAAPTLPPAPKRRARKPQRSRTSLIPQTCRLNVDPPRINAIYSELIDLSVEKYPNACSVLFRVFIELSVDHYAEERKILTELQLRNDPLAKRLKAVAADLRKRGKISDRLKTAVDKVADSKFVLAASTVTLNQYVHNQYVYPRPDELRSAWDEVQPFMERLWSA